MNNKLGQEPKKSFFSRLFNKQTDTPYVSAGQITKQPTNIIKPVGGPLISEEVVPTEEIQEQPADDNQL